MAGFGTGLFRRSGKCAAKARRISDIHAELVFRGTPEKCAHDANEISTLRPELVFRQIPGKFVQRRGDAQWFGGRIGLGSALLDAICGRVVRVATPPIGLGFPAANLLAVRLAAGALALAHPSVRAEPPSADRAGSLPSLGHGAFIVTTPAHWLRSDAVDHFSRAGVGQFS
jgi:hypothetical protein